MATDPDSDYQREYFESANATHYEWQTRPGYFADTERALVDVPGLASSHTLLEIGCGEGGNLFHLGGRQGWVGVDFSHRKVEFASKNVPDVRFICCDAAALPLQDEAFDSVLIRDVLHHVPDRERVVSEAVRTLRADGLLVLIEPNVLSPLIAAQVALVKAERGAAVSRFSRLQRELEGAGLQDIRISRAQPLPVARALLHPRLGTSSLGDNMAVVHGLRAFERLARRFVPSFAWTYLVAQARKRS